MAAITREIKHYTRWLYEYDQYRDTEIWLYRRTWIRFFGVAVWRWTSRKVHIPIWSYMNHQLFSLPFEYYSAFGGEKVHYDWATGVIKRLQ